MPGMLKRSHDQLDASGTGAESPVTDSPRPSKRQAVNGLHGDTRMNGASPVNEAVQTNGFLQDARAEEHKAAKMPLPQGEDAPPEIFHVTQGFQSLSVLIQRVAQETFNELDDLINSNAEMQPPQVNGHGSGQPSQAMIDKKTKIWDFAQRNRAKLIKLLVLSDWGRRAEDVSKVIDINNWIMTQKTSFKDAVSWIGELKRIMNRWQEGPPDVKTSLETLSTGKAAGISDLGYLPQPSLSPAELLRGLKTLNTLLTIRLNLHETVPPEMSDFRMASGRATFTVADEFELDLSLADDDPNSQLYFIDFRFAFSPCDSTIQNPRLRDHIEGRVNDELRRQGLVGCYEFLHGLVSTYKLSILRDQAHQLAWNQWGGNLRVDLAHRSVIVQYWLQRPGKKNWIEIGIRKRGKRGAADHASQTETPELSLRWHRHGKEVVDHGIHLDGANLSLEALLAEVIARHTNFIYKETKRKLKEEPIYAGNMLSVKHRAHPWEPTESAMTVQINDASTVKLTQEPVSGAFVLAPPSPLNDGAARRLNESADPIATTASRLAELRAYTVLESIESSARTLGWKQDRILKANQETRKRLFNSTQLWSHFYRPPGWSQSWALGLTTNLAGDQWWLVETRKLPENPSPEDFASERYQPLFQAIRIARKDGAIPTSDPSFATLTDLQNMGATLLCNYLDCRELTKKRIEYTQQSSAKHPVKFHIPDIFIRYDLSKASWSPNDPSAANAKAWCHETIKSSFVGFTRSGKLTRNLVCGRLRTPIPNVHAITEQADQALVFHPRNGNFVFRFAHTVGESGIPELFERFFRIRNLLGLIQTVRKHDFVCTRVSLTSLTFTYGEAAPLGDEETGIGAFNATIEFPPDEDKSIHFEAGNPHLQISDFLKAALNDPHRDGFEDVAANMMETLPLLRCLSSLENLYRKTKEGPMLRIFPRSATSFGVRYDDREHVFQYEVRFRNRNDRSYWQFVPILMKSGKEALDAGRAANGKAANPATAVKMNGVQPGKKTALQTKPEERGAPVVPPKLFKETWQRLTRENGENWTGLGYGFLAEKDGVERLIRYLDDAIVALFRSDHNAAPIAEDTPAFEGPQASSSEQPKVSTAPSKRAVKNTSKVGGATRNMGKAAPGQVIDLD